MSKDMISIIIPVYNIEKYLRKCIESILIQTYHDLEIILVDDGSPDVSPQICDEYAENDKRVKVIHKKNGGVSSAKNAGLSIATGNYITFVDGDDFLDEDTYEFLINNIKKYDADISVCGKYKYYEDGTEEKDNESITPVHLVSNQIEWFVNANRNAAQTWNKLYKKELIGNIRFDENITMAEDWKFNYQVIKKSRGIIYHAIPKYHYLIRDNGITGKDKWQDVLGKAAVAKYFFELEKDDSTLSKYAYENYANTHILAINKMIRQKAIADVAFEKNRRDLLKIKFNIFRGRYKLKLKAAVLLLWICPYMYIWMLRRH